MNHYQLYKMISGRIAEAACAILAMIALVGVGIFRGQPTVWLFWGMAILCTVVRWFLTRCIEKLEAKFNLDAR